MSIKIYTGFELIWKDTIYMFNVEMNKVREEATFVANKLSAEKFVQVATLLYDRAQLGLSPKDNIKQSYLEHAESEIMNWRIAASKSKKSLEIEVDNFGLEITLYPLEDGRILGMSFSKENEMHDLWGCKSYVKEYRYWDTIDAPKSISKEEWHKRAIDWNKAIPYTNDPSLHGCIIRIVPESYFAMLYEVKDLLLPKYIPITNRRVALLTNTISINEFIKRKGDSFKEDYTKGYNKYKEWTCSEEGKIAMGRIIANITDKLNNNLTIEDLKANGSIQL